MKLVKFILVLVPLLDFSECKLEETCDRELSNFELALESRELWALKSA